MQVQVLLTAPFFDGSLQDAIGRPQSPSRQEQHGERRVSIFEKWLEFTPNFLCLYAKWDPGMMVHKHGHNSDHILFVLEGEMMCGDVRCTKGMHITLEHGAAFEHARARQASAFARELVTPDSRGPARRGLWA